MKWIVFCILFINFKALAHPVAYEGAFSFMSINSSETSENTLVYSPKYWLGTGIKHIEMDGKKWSNAHLGLLLKRWNEFHSQANVYIFGGPGVVWDKDTSEYFTRYGFQGDWETRRLYTMAKVSIADAHKLSTEEYYEGRVGFAPYLAGYNELNSWVILQVSHSRSREEQTQVTPLIRMFYKNTLWEMGSSLNGSWLLNFMARY